MIVSWIRGIAAFCLAASLLGMPAQARAADALAVEVGRLAAEVSSGARIESGGFRIAFGPLIGEIYQLRENAPAWTDPALFEDLVNEIVDARSHGLRDEDFELARLRALAAAAQDGPPEDAALFEIAATDAAIRLLHHMAFGKVDPETLDSEWNFARPLAPGDPARLIDQFLEIGSIGALVEDIRVDHPFYEAARKALSEYRAISAAGGWPEVPSEPVLKPGMTDPAVAILRTRLAISGDLGAAAAAEAPDLYDPALEAAVMAFQDRHGLEVDGIVGRRTFAALNRPVGDRIDQLRLTLERARWLMRDLGDDFVLVNIGGAETYLVRNGERIWRTRSIVGQQYRKTPVFQDEITFMEFNPTWTVPASIFRQDKLARIREDPGYLARGGYQVIDASGRTVSPTAVNWQAQNPPVTLVQKPGPKNALGQVKFMFPNKYSIYLHDTDDRSLFSRADRNLSSGCVRIEDPFTFADLLMRDDPSWSPERREAILASGKTTRITLPTPLPVLLTYFTAWVDDKGTVQFRDDIYDRDGPLLTALNAEFSQ